VSREHLKASITFMWRRLCIFCTEKPAYKIIPISNPDNYCAPQGLEWKGTSSGALRNELVRHSGKNGAEAMMVETPQARVYPPDHYLSILRCSPRMDSRP